MSMPNIVYIHSHDTGRCVQPYGYAIDTPNIQKLAEEGVLFRQAFCAAPTCSPSRAALLTGQNPHSAGMLGLAHRGFAIKDFSQHIFNVLKQHGYTTAHTGVQHTARWKDVDKLGYDEILKPEEGEKNGAPAAARYLARAKNAGKPFFLSVGFIETHLIGKEADSTFNIPPVYDNPHARPVTTLPDTPDTRNDMADFAACAHRLDSYMGQVFAALDANGLRENTLVICTTDHGVPLPGCKCNLTDHGLGVMLILRGPGGGFAGGKIIDAMVSHIDLFPTVCELAGIPKPAWLEGQSLLPLIRGEAMEIHDEIFGEVTYHAAYEPMRAVRTKRYKYIRRFGDRRTPVGPNLDDSLSRRVMESAGYMQRQLPEEELYDLQLDPAEGVNRSADPAFAPVLQEMRARLTRWMEQTHDPLLKGPVPPPPGAEVNDAAGRFPYEPPLVADAHGVLKPKAS